MGATVDWLLARGLEFYLECNSGLYGTDGLIADAAALSAATGSAYDTVHEKILRELLARGHRVHVALDRKDELGGDVWFEQLAREFFPGEDPVGRRVTQMGDLEVVGVVASVARAQLGEQRKALIYYPLRQMGSGAVAVVVRGALPL